MKTVEEIAQWVIDNRYAKSEDNKVSDHEMYHELIESIKAVSGVLADIVGQGEQLCQMCKCKKVEKEQLCGSCWGDVNA